jgi:hypothetical protein
VQRERPNATNHLTAIAMYGTFSIPGKGDTNGINGKSVEVTEILGNSVTAKLENGRKVHVPLKALVKLEADLTFSEDGSVEVVEHDAEEAGSEVK